MRPFLIASIHSRSTIAGATPRRRRRLKTPSSGIGRPYAAEVAELLEAHLVDDRVAALRRRLGQDLREERAGRRAAEDVRRRPHGEADARRAALREVVGDLHAGAAGADDEDVAARVRRGVAVRGGVDERPAEPVAAGPLRDVAVVEVAGRDDDVLRGQVARRGADHPAVTVAVDALDARAQPHVELVAVGVAVEVAHHLVARGERADPAGVARARQLREPAARVQPQPVVARIPRRADRVAPFEHGGRDPSPAELRRRGEPGRSRSHDDRRLSLCHVRLHSFENRTAESTGTRPRAGCGWSRRDGPMREPREHEGEPLARARTRGADGGPGTRSQGPLRHPEFAAQPTR